jgi:hypothetical protein
MGKLLRFAATMGCAVLFALTWSGDVAADVDAGATATTISVTEPTTDQPVTLVPTAEPITKDPLAPYGIGPSEEAVPYEALTPEQQEAADHGFDTATSAATHNAFAAAVVERSNQARAEAAQHQLGIDSLDTLGVVP